MTVQDELRWILNSINEIWALRSQEKKILFYELIEKIILNKDLFEEFALMNAENENNLKTFKFIWQELLNNKIYSFTMFDENWLTEKKYSWHFITISDEDYIEWWYSLHASDFITNFESLWSWVFDYMNNEYIISREDMVKMLQWLDVVKWFKFKNTIWSSRFSLNPVFQVSNLNQKSLTILYKQFSQPELQEKFINVYKQYFERKNLFDKINKIYKAIMKDITSQFLEKNNIKTVYEWLEKDMWAQFWLAKELQDKLISQENFVFSWKNTPNEWQKIKFDFQVSWSNISFKWWYTETFDKEIIFQDLRKTETRQWISKTMSKIKDEFEKLKFYENRKYKKSNTFISEIKKSNFENKEEFENFINSDKYKSILNFKERRTLK